MALHREQLPPEEIRLRLTLCGLFLSAYEMLLLSVLGDPKRFFISILSEGKQLAEDEADYQREVLALDQNKIKASCLWLQKMGALEPSDTTRILAIRDHRNELAHEMPHFVMPVGKVKDIKVDMFNDMLRLMNKINVWWFQNIEATINPDLEGKDISSVESLPELLLKYMMQLVSEAHGKVGSVH